MRYISLIVGLCCVLNITSCVTTQRVASIRLTLCSLPFSRIAAREFSYPTKEACREAAKIFFDAAPANHPDAANFSETKLNDNLYMWRGADTTEVRFVVRSSNRIPQAINYWEIKKSSGDDSSEKLKKKIDDVVDKLEEPGCGCKAIRRAKETPDDEVAGGKKAWRAIVKCQKRTNSPAKRMRQDEVSGLVINPSYP